MGSLVFETVVDRRARNAVFETAEAGIAEPSIAMEVGLANPCLAAILGAAAMREAAVVRVAAMAAWADSVVASPDLTVAVVVVEMAVVSGAIGKLLWSIEGPLEGAASIHS